MGDNHKNLSNWKSKGKGFKAPGSKCKAWENGPNGKKGLGVSRKGGSPS